MPQKDRRRALRRHHRARLIIQRARLARAMQLTGSSSIARPEGSLTDGQYWLGCNRAKCGLCHPHKRYGYADRQRARETWQRDWLQES